MYEANAVVLLELFVIYLMIIAGAHLDILAIRLTKLGVATNNEKETIERANTDNDLKNCIELHKKILKLFGCLLLLGKIL